MKKKRVMGYKIGRFGTGIILCEKCNEYVGKLNYSNFEYVYLQTICECGSSGYIEYGIKPEGKREVAEYNGNQLLCPNCHKVLFEKGDAVVSFSFDIDCVCGKMYNVRDSINGNLEEKAIID